MKRQLAIVIMVVMVLTIMSALASCEPECEHMLIKYEKAEATCAHEGNDEYYECTNCGGFFTDALAENPIDKPVTYEKLEHTDADKDHKCDVCGSTAGKHEAAEGKHTCDHCGQTVSDCADADSNHLCDVCNGTVGDHVAAEGKHTCDYCGKIATECTDVDAPDHVCDVCGKELGSCADENKDHACDVCSAEMGVHESAAGGHSCDYCGGPVTECEDSDINHECDICGYPVGEHVEQYDHMCGYCWTIVSDCYDNDKNHQCDICFAKMGVHKPPVVGHRCEYCGYKYSECTPKADDGDCTTPVYCTKCPEIVIPAQEHKIDWKHNEDTHWGSCVNEGCKHTVESTSHYSYAEGKCICGFTCEDKCDVCGKCNDISCVVCNNKCMFADTNKVIHFVPNPNMAAPEGPDGIAVGAAGSYNYDTSITAQHVVLADGTRALLVTLPNGTTAHSGVSFKNNDADSIKNVGMAGFNCGNPTTEAPSPVRMHFTNHGDSEITFKYSNIDYYYDKGAITLTLAPGETKSALMYVDFGQISVGLNSQVVFLKDAAAGASLSIWGEQVASQNLTSISVANPANKLQYVVGDTFSAEGLVLKANGHYMDRVYISTNYVTNLDGYTFTADDVGTKAVIVEFAGKLLWYTIEVADHVHNVQYVPETAPVECQKDGLEAHYACTICGEYFTDETGSALAGAPKTISCHTKGDESKVLPGAPVPCSKCGAQAGVRDMTNWVLFNLTTTLDKIGSNIKNGKVEKIEMNGVPATKFYIGAGTVGATPNSSFYLKMSDNDGDRQTVIPNRGNNTPAGQNRKVILYYENYGDEAITMNLQNDTGAGNGKITVPAKGTGISTFEVTATGGANWFHYYVDYNATKDTSFGVYGYIYVYDGETDAPTIKKSAEKLTYKVGETFSSKGLVLNATIPASNARTLNVYTGFNTDYDGHTFTENEIGSHTVTVSFAGKTVTYLINVVADAKCDQGIHEYAFKSDESLFVEMNGSDAMYKKVCIHCGAASTEAYAAGKVAFVPHRNGLDGGHTIEYVTLEDGKIAAKLTFNSDVAAGWKTTIEASGHISGTNVLFPVPTEGRRLYMEMTSSADIKLTWQQEFYGDRDPFTLDLKAGETASHGQFVKYTGSNTSSNLPYQEIVAESAIPAGTVVYFTGYFYDLTDVSGISIYTPATSTLFKVGETFSSAGLILKPTSASTLFNNVDIYNPVTNLDGYTFKAEDAGKIFEVVVYIGNAKTSYNILVIE